MNEITLNALINLFALFSAISESNKKEAVRNFSLYLHQHFGISDDNEYLRLFEELLDLYGVDGSPVLPVDMHEQAYSVSTNIRSWLKKDEQIMVFLRFLELVKSGNLQKAQGLFDTLAEVFEIGKTEIDKFFSFIFYSSPGEINSPDFLIVSSVESKGNFSYRHIYEKNIDGELIFLRSPLIGHYIFVFHGNEYLTIEGNPVIPDRFYAFREGNIIRGPRISPVYYADVSAGFVNSSLRPWFIFSGEEIEFRFRKSTNGLHPFSFFEKSGQLIAIMGGSGVGKSTLLNILNGNIPVQQGKIKLNGVEIYEQAGGKEGLIGYVPQDDLLFEELTVWENLFYSASLSFDGLSHNAIEEKVGKVLQELELQAYKDLKVGSPLKKVISGGQRKRLNIALELIREPAVLFVDEPTSGLSSTDSEKVVLLLKQQARKGKLIVVNIHQPSSAIFKLFDKLWIMDAGGRIIYSGNPLDAIIYFKREVSHVNAEICECIACGNVNPEQVLEIVETKKIDNSGNFLTERRFTPEYWYDRFRRLARLRNVADVQPVASLPEVDTKIPGRLKQFRIFFQRNLQIKITDTQYMVVNLLEAPVLALIVAWFTRFTEGTEYVFFENKSFISYLFMSIVVMLFMGMSVSAEEIIKDRKILQRESFLNLSRFSYLNSKVVLLIILSAFQSFSFVLIGNLILEIQDMTFAYWLVLFFVAVFANLVGLNISAAFDSVVTIYILIPLLLIPQILLCGVIVEFDDLQNKNASKDAVPVAGEIMASRWAFEALAVHQFKENRYMDHFFEIEKEMARTWYRADILTTELTGQTDLVYGWVQAGKPTDEIAHKLTILRNEIEKLDAETGMPEFPLMDKLVPESFNEQVAESTKEHLQRIKEVFSARYNNARKEKDQLIYRLEDEHGEQFLYEQKMEYHNKALEAMVLKTGTDEFYRETPTGYMQKIAPVYKEPEFSNGRAHFLASQKNFFGYEIGTLVFNTGVIALMAVFLYVALYFNWIRKLLRLPETIRTGRIMKKSGRRNL